MDNRWRPIVGFGVAAWAVSTLLFAETPANGGQALGDKVKVGDAVSVTRWSGGKVKGYVTELRDCALRLRGPLGIHQISLSDVKTVRRHRQRKSSPGATTAMLDIANQCDEVGCAPAALAFAGIGALVQGIDDLTHPPKVVYRSKTQQNQSPACARR